MARRASASREYLELHRGKWRVSVPVPKTLHRTLGTRLKKSLGTDSLTVANQLKWPIVREYKHLIANGGAAATDHATLAQEFRQQGFCGLQGA